MRAARRTGPLLATLWLCVLSSLGYSTAARAQGEGPRAYELQPAGSRALNVYGMFGRGNTSFDPGAVVPGTAEVYENGSIIEYSHGFALAGNAGSLLVSLPVGNVRRSVSVGGVVQSDASSGIGDLQITGAFGLLGSPALEEKDYEAYRPHLALSALTRVYVPTGAYDRTSAVNVGQNRWALQLGVSSAYYLGDSFLDSSLTSFELIPSVIWYGDNNEPTSGNHSSQAPLTQLEGHVTRNLNQSFWLSLDALFISGGETTTNGVSDQNRQRSLALGATASVALADTVSVSLSYTDVVSKDSSGLRGHVIRLIAEFSL